MVSWEMTLAMGLPWTDYDKHVKENAEKGSHIAKFMQQICHKFEKNWRQGKDSDHLLTPIGDSADLFKITEFDLLFAFFIIFIICDEIKQH
jgi:hypothetical protein